MAFDMDGPRRGDGPGPAPRSSHCHASNPSTAQACFRDEKSGVQTGDIAVSCSRAIDRARRFAGGPPLRGNAAKKRTLPGADS